MGLDKVVEQLETVVSSYVPQLISALVVLVGGWFIAHLFAKVTFVGYKKLSISKKLSKVMGDSEKEAISNVGFVLSKVVFYIIMLFVLVGFFQVLGLSILNEPINKFLETIFEYAPRLISPVFLLFIAWIIANIVKFLILQFSKKIDLDKKLGKTS